MTPGSPWNYALLLHNDYEPDDDLKFVSKGLNSTYPFSPDGAPNYIEAMVRTIAVSIIIININILK